MNEAELDKALSVPLAELNDGGFTGRVMLRVLADKARRERAVTFVLGGIAALLCALMPLTTFGQEVDRWAFHFGRDLLRAAQDASNLEQLMVPLSLIAGALTFAMLVIQSAPAAIRSRTTSGPRTSS